MTRVRIETLLGQLRYSSDRAAKMFPRFRRQIKRTLGGVGGASLSSLTRPCPFALGRSDPGFVGERDQKTGIGLDPGDSVAQLSHPRRVLGEDTQSVAQPVIHDRALERDDSVLD